MDERPLIDGTPHGPTSTTKRLSQGKTWPKVALATETTPQRTFAARSLRKHAYYADKHSLVFNADVEEALDRLTESQVRIDCIVTSPPFYGQRDYEVKGQIGLELHPQGYIEKLVRVFDKCVALLKRTGSLWVNLGDTYWSGRGQHRSGETKQSARRFGLRPQDRKGDGVWCRPKQLPAPDSASLRHCDAGCRVDRSE